MADHDLFRETIDAVPSAEFWQERLAKGWQPVAVEWRRPSDSADPEAGRLREAVPYGLQVSADCQHLIENPQEIEALTVMLECIVADKKLSEVATELDQRGLPPRDASNWTQVTVFEMLPRLIEVAPRILSTQAWSERREKVLRLVS